MREPANSINEAGRGMREKRIYNAEAAFSSWGPSCNMPAGWPVKADGHKAHHAEIRAFVS
jgi:uncharacterized protein YbdZ (MbtH family)